MKASIVSYLEKKFGSNKFIFSEIPEKYSYDESTVYKCFPEAVFLPENEEEIREFIKISKERKIKIVPRGGGTGVCGGAVALFGGIVLSTEKMNKIIDFDEINLCVEVQAGVVNGELKVFLEDRGYYYPPDPQSYDTSFIGGNIATNAGGPRAIRYGTTKDYVMGLNLVTGEGKIINTGGKVYKYSSGYNLNELVCGSEGTLGVITKAIIRFIPLPLKRIVFLLPFLNLESAMLFVLDAQRANLPFSAFEFIDDTAVNYIEKFLKRSLPFSERAKCYLFAELEWDGNDRYLEEVEKLAKKNNSLDIFVATDRVSEERLWEARKKISYAFKEYSKKVYKADVVVPRGKIAHFIKKTKEISSENMPVACFGHIGDGNIHVNILELKENERVIDAKKILNLIMNIVKELGGYPSGEHGIGVAKKEFLKNFFSSYHISIWKKMKKVLDPNNILNPGKIF
ncbi:MAG: FAD-binding protein [Proteobacteria bacterium]|nr:FAD-binding protein [Pseudomonadota bacterium]